MDNLKTQLLAACHDYVNQRIATFKQAMENAQAAANEEGKSSAGDKYETGRAMMQIERDKAAEQLEEALKLKKILDGMNSSDENDTVFLGSVVTTTNFNFYMAISAGKLIVDGKEYIAVSTDSPISKLMIGKKVSDEFLFNKRNERIVGII
jgi:transcription elongation GreA/GreB family factor